MDLQYHIVDVFTSTPLEGNALAVFHAAEVLDTSVMQRIARELNLSETTFIGSGAPAAPARVRIFTPTYEMDFAGHPTLGTAFVMRRLGIVSSETSTFALRENIGPITVRVDASDDSFLWLTTPAIHHLGAFDRAACAAAISLDEDDLLPGLPCEVLSAGNPNLFVPLRNKDTVDRARLDVAAFLGLVAERPGATCIFPFTPTQTGAYSRMFAPQLGIVEDPATGSAAGPLAVFMMRHHLATNGDRTRLVNEQGTKMGRRSLIHAFIHGKNGSGGIEVGGNVTHVAQACMHLEIASPNAALV